MTVLEETRKRVGEKFIIGMRMVADEDWETGLSREEGVEIAKRLKNSGRIDFLNIIRGHIDTDAALSKVIPIHGMAASPHLDFAGEVRAATDIRSFMPREFPTSQLRGMRLPRVSWTWSA